MRVFLRGEDVLDGYADTAQRADAESCLLRELPSEGFGFGLAPLKSAAQGAATGPAFVLK